MPSRNRAAFTVLEMIVGCGLLVTLISIIGPLSMAASRLATQTDQARRIDDELENQLARLVALPADEVESRLMTIGVSDDLALDLPDAVLSGELIRDDFDGDQVRLTFERGDGFDRGVMTLTGWLIVNEEAAQ